MSKVYHLERAEPEVVKGKPIRAVYNNEREPSPSELLTEEFMNNPTKRVTPELTLDQVKAFLKDTNLTPPLQECPNRQQWIRLQM